MIVYFIHRKGVIWDMKFYYAKREIKCSRCPGNIERGELYIRTNHRNPVTGKYYSFPYHFECYKEYFNERLTNDANHFKGILTKPKKLGRPKKYASSKLADRTRALIYYHKKAGNTEKVAELERWMNDLLIRK